MTDRARRALIPYNSKSIEWFAFEVMATPFFSAVFSLPELAYVSLWKVQAEVH